jgi:hypothetical protein
MEKTFPPIKQKHTTKRPRYLTVLSIILVIWGVGCSLAFAPGTLKVIMSAGSGGPAYAFFRVVMIQAIWIAIAVSGIGIYRGLDWVRGVLVVALVSLFFTTATTSTFNHMIGKAVLYAFLIYLVFTPSAKAYFLKSRLAVHNQPADNI